MKDYRRVRQKLSDAKAQLEEIQQREAAAKQKAHWDEFEQLKQFKADTEAKARESARQAIYDKNANAILSGVAADQRDDVALMLAGMQQAGKINLYDETEGAAAKLREQLAADRPSWFKNEANAEGGLGRGAGYVPDGPLIGNLDAMTQLTDEQFKQRYVQQRNKGGARL